MFGVGRVPSPAPIGTLEFLRTVTVLISANGTSAILPWPALVCCRSFLPEADRPRLPPIRTPAARVSDEPPNGDPDSTHNESETTMGFKTKDGGWSLQNRGFGDSTGSAGLGETAGRYRSTHPGGSHPEEWFELRSDDPAPVGRMSRSGSLRLTGIIPAQLVAPQREWSCGRRSSGASPPPRGASACHARCRGIRAQRGMHGPPRRVPMQIQRWQEEPAGRAFRWQSSAIASTRKESGHCLMPTYNKESKKPERGEGPRMVVLFAAGLHKRGGQCST